MKTLEDSHRPMKDVMSPLVKWVKDSAAKFNPAQNTVETENGDTIEYDYLVVATGMEVHYEAIPGLVDAMKVKNGPVCSIYSPLYVNRVYDSFQNFKGGNAIFTFPASPVKCPGAPQKICYIFEHYTRKNKKRSGAQIYYNSSLPVIFGVKHYADALWKVVKKRDINVNLRTNLVEVLPSGREAVFENLDTKERKTVDVSCWCANKNYQLMNFLFSSIFCTSHHR
jgi:NADPH-dependent 2,4-dienoyl-CoA reductase/sulfur reductase-like enzyme